MTKDFTSYTNREVEANQVQILRTAHVSTTIFCSTLITHIYLSQQRTTVNFLFLLLLEDQTFFYTYLIYSHNMHFSRFLITSTLATLVLSMLTILYLKILTNFLYSEPSSIRLSFSLTI
jgi:hypothetical protein